MWEWLGGGFVLGLAFVGSKAVLWDLRRDDTDRKTPMGRGLGPEVDGETLS